MIMKVEETTEETMTECKPAGEDDGGAGLPGRNGSDAAAKPSLPPGLAANAGKTVNEVWAELNKTPLFMTELEDNDDIAALQALSYEGTPLENAADFKERGNECFRVKGYVDANEFYTKGILVLAAEERKRAAGTGDGDGAAPSPDDNDDDNDDVAQQREMLEALYVNRAACHLGLSNYRSCWLDCAAALRLNPRNVKASYRAARALLAVDRVTEARDACAHGLTLDAANAPLRALAASVAERTAFLAAKRQRHDERVARHAHDAQLLRAALAMRNIPLRSTADAPDLADARLALVPVPDDARRSTLVVPTLLLYPLHLESDFIKAFDETQTLADHLAYVLPLPWDLQAVYTPAAVSCYVETRDGGLLKMGKRVPLLRVLGTGRVEIVNEVLRIFVVPTDKADQWAATFKAEKAAVRGQGTQGGSAS